MKKIISLTLAIIMILTLGLTACNNTNGADSTETTTTQAQEESTESSAATSDDTTVSSTECTTEKPSGGDVADIDGNLNINVMVLNGTTGFGMAQLIDKSANDLSLLNYNFTVEKDASNIVAALVNGTADIAALPTNAAANLFNKNKSVQMLAVNTLGVLYLITGEGVTVNSIADLEGKTVYCPAQNPTFIFSYICTENGLINGKNITIDNTYTAPADLNAALSSGAVDIAVLPEPMVTIAKNKNSSLKVALDLTAEWNKVAPEGSLMQGCVVVRKEFAAAHPNEVATFLSEYEASVNFVKESPASAGKMIEAREIFSSGAVAAKAIPNCNLCFISGEDMKPLLDEFYQILYSVAPQSIGNSVPTADFYYDSDLYYVVK